jgi:hypothetical protein
MIAQLLNRGFILDQMEAIQTQLEQDVQQQRRGGKDTPQLDLKDYKEALDHIEDALSAEKKKSTGQPGFAPEEQRRRGEKPAELDDFSFFSRDPIVSIVQSALEQHLDRAESGTTVVQEEPADDRRRGADSKPVVTDRSLKGYQPHRRDTDGRRIFDRFSITDIGWVSSKVAEGIRLFRGRKPFNDKPANPMEIGEQARVILVGDWATGLPRAQKVATAMRYEVQTSLAKNQDTHIIHLGDAYYSGFEYEYKNRFLPYWPIKSDEASKAGSWSLSGNHDMYSGGYGYFDTLLKDPRFVRQGQASFFRLYNKYWQILGLDTAWDDNGLKDPQSAWVRDTLDSNRQKSIMLTHHQLFSAYEGAPDVGRVLRDKLGWALTGDQIYAAFWGHEHRCVLYNTWGTIKYPRLIGHGGVPVYTTHGKTDPYPPAVNYEYRRFITSSFGLERWALLGFAVLDFDGPNISIRYVDEDGDTHKKEVI